MLSVARAADYFGIVDQPGLRKTHSKITLLLGGLAIFLGIEVAIFIGALILLATGLLEDVYSLKSLSKLGGQAAAGFLPT